MKKREKPAKRAFAKRDPAMHLDRIPASRLLRIQPDPARREVVEVRLSRTRKQMRLQLRRFRRAEDPRTQGCVVHYFSTISKRLDRLVKLEGRVIARMFLNQRDVQNYPGEIIAHECTHAGMVWARMQKADLRHIPGEEVLAHAVGQMTQQLANRLSGMQFFKRDVV